MKSNKFTATLIAGTFSLSMVLAGCGASQPAATTTAATTTAATTAAATTPAATTTAATTAATTGTAAEDTILYWYGESDKGDAVIYGEDDRDDTAAILVFGAHEGSDPELLLYSGTTKADGTKVTITDYETKEAFSFDVVEASDKGIVIDLGTHGKVTLNAVTQKQFEDELNKIAEEINKIGDELRNMSEEDINQFLAVLGTAIQAEANGAMATNK